MTILVTGANGFIGKNIIERLARIEDIIIKKFDRKSSIEELSNYINDIDFIFHLAGVNRPENKEEFYSGNSDLTKQIIDTLKTNGKCIPIVYSSSTQAKSDNDYGQSKLMSENHLTEYSKQNNVPVYIYRLPGIFGKWSKANYNSVISTWCYNIARNKEIQINNRDVILELVYIDDVVETFVSHVNDKSFISDCKVNTVYKKSLGEIADLLYFFKENRKTLLIPDVGSEFQRALYATYLSYLSTDNFSYELKGYSDERGTFYEILKTLNSGQFSISTTKPGDIIRGNHYHNTKNEKFLVVKGRAIIQLRDINSAEIIEYNVSDKKMEIVEMIPGYTHNIKNISNEEMILLIWANEVYNQNKPDTYFLEV